MNKGWICALALAAASAASAGNAGRVQGLGMVTGPDGKKYIFVKHTNTNVEFGSSNSSDRLWGTFYIPLDENEVAAVSQYSSLQKALQATDLYLEASSGSSVENGPVSGWAIIVKSWHLFK